MMSSVENIEQYLNDKYERICVPDMTVGEFAYYNPKGIFLVTMQSHITCIVYGNIVDTFDCGNREMICAWYVKD